MRSVLTLRGLLFSGERLSYFPVPRNALMSGGNAVDAAIAGAFCLGEPHRKLTVFRNEKFTGGLELHAAGLGDDLLMTIYQK